MNYSNIYTIHFRELVNILTPPFLRKIRYVDFLEALLKPLEEINYSLKVARKDAIYKVTHNGQVVYLEAVLNDSYDQSLRRIYIDDFPIFDPLYIYPEADERPVYIYADSEENPVYLYPEGSGYQGAPFDFVVHVPVEYRPLNAFELELFLTQMRGLINYYKLASKRYTIVWIT